MTEAKKKRLRERQIELLKLFEGDFYQEKRIDDKWYVKSWNGGTKRWQVSVFTLGSFTNYKAFSEERKKAKEEEEVKPQMPFERPTLESVKKLLK